MHDELILTASSKRQKEEELSYLLTVKRPEITESIRKAREYGDLSENFEYQSARQAQAILNGRIAELESLLSRARVVGDAAVGGDTIGLGAIVKVRDMEMEDEWEYTLVDATSADPANDRISFSSPVGQATAGQESGRNCGSADPGRQGALRNYWPAPRIIPDQHWNGIPLENRFVPRSREEERAQRTGRRHRLRPVLHSRLL